MSPNNPAPERPQWRTPPEWQQRSGTPPQQTPPPEWQQRTASHPRDVQERRSMPARSRSTPVIWLDRLPLVLLGVPILALWWAMGGKYTIDGGPMVANTIFAFFRFETRLAPIANGSAYIVLCWLPVLISIIERRNRPRRGLVPSMAVAAALLIWAVVSLYDMSSTYLAVTNPPADAWIITQQLAAIKPLAVLWTAATTFLPEIALVALIRYALKG